MSALVCFFWSVVRVCSHLAVVVFLTYCVRGYFLMDFFVILLNSVVVTLGRSFLCSCILVCVFALCNSFCVGFLHGLKFPCFSARPLLGLTPDPLSLFVELRALPVAFVSFRLFDLSLVLAAFWGDLSASFSMFLSSYLLSFWCTLCPLADRYYCNFWFPFFVFCFSHSCL